MLRKGSSPTIEDMIRSHHRMQLFRKLLKQIFTLYKSTNPVGLKIRWKWAKLSIQLTLCSGAVIQDSDAARECLVCEVKQSHLVPERPKW